MYKITIKGEAKTKYPLIQALDGVDCQDDFSEYFDNDATYYHNISSGYMDFRYENDKLWTYTTYESDRELTNEELTDLAEYTQGQWSDGIGEGFEQESCMNADEPYRQLTEEEEKIYDDEPFTTEVFISPWFNGQELIVTQEKIQ